MDKEFWKALMIRVIKTWCQAFCGAIGTTATMLSQVNWVMALSTATLAAIICFVWNLGAGLPEVPETNKDYSKEIQDTYNGESMGDMMEGNYDEAENYGSDQ